MEGRKVITEDQCAKVLKRYLKSDDFKIKYYSVVPLTAQLDGLMGDQYTLKIHYGAEDEDNIAQFFLKTLDGSNPVMFEITKTMGAFEKEAFYYETLVPLLQSRGLNFNITAKSYLCEPYVIVLEDLSLLSYRGTVKSKPLDLKHCKKCLETLAKFHVAPILYEIAKTKELGKAYTLQDQFRDTLKDKIFTQQDSGAARFMRCSVKGLFQLIEVMPDNNTSRQNFITKLQDVVNDMMSFHDDLTGFRCTILHSDLWSNNFLQRYEDGEIADCKLIDFQTINYGPPAMDVLQFILTNTRKSFRDQHLKELLTYYYDTLKSLLGDKGHSGSEILPEDEYIKACELFKLPAKILAVVDRCITVMSDEHFAEAAKTEEGFSKYLFEERGEYIVKSFKENEPFRELMIEDVTELRGMLLDGW